MRRDPHEFDDEDGVRRQQDAQSSGEQDQKEATTSKMCQAERVFPTRHGRRSQEGTFTMSLMLILTRLTTLTKKLKGPGSGDVFKSRPKFSEKGCAALFPKRLLQSSARPRSCSTRR